VKVAKVIVDTLCMVFWGLVVLVFYGALLGVILCVGWAVLGTRGGVKGWDFGRVAWLGEELGRG